MTADLNDNFARQDAMLIKQSVDANALKHGAYLHVESAFRQLEVRSTSVKADDDDVVANLAKSWFQEKAAGK